MFHDCNWKTTQEITNKVVELGLDAQMKLSLVGFTYHYNALEQ